MSVNRFSIPWDRLAATAKADVDLVVRKATVEIFRAIVDKSPVDTGRFAGNWNCSQGAVNTTTTGDIDRTRGRTEAERAMTFGSGDIVYFVNALPYAYRLEYEGWSKQAPAGMVRVTIAEFEQYVKKAIAT